MQIRIKDVVHFVIVGLFTISILVLLYWVSLKIAVGMGIDQAIIPGITGMIPDMRGDIKIFTGFICFLTSIIPTIIANKSEKKEKISTKIYQEVEDRKKNYEKSFDYKYPPTYKINSESKRIAKLLIKKSKKEEISLNEFMAENIKPEFKKEEIDILMRTVHYFTSMRYDIISTTPLKLESWD